MLVPVFFSRLYIPDFHVLLHPLNSAEFFMFVIHSNNDIKVYSNKLSEALLKQLSLCQAGASFVSYLVNLKIYDPFWVIS